MEIPVRLEATPNEALERRFWLKIKVAFVPGGRPVLLLNCAHAAQRFPHRLLPRRHSCCDVCGGVPSSVVRSSIRSTKQQQRDDARVAV